MGVWQSSNICLRRREGGTINIFSESPARLESDGGVRRKAGWNMTCRPSSRIGERPFFQLQGALAVDKFEAARRSTKLGRTAIVRPARQRTGRKKTR